MKKVGDFVKVTDKILESHSDWNSIIGKSGVILEETNSSVRIHFLSDGKKHLEIIYSIPKDCVKEISEKEALLDLL